jgi:hypothetical protein
MSGCNCIEQKHGGVQTGLADAQERVQVQSQMCCARVLNCTPDHEFRTFKQSVLCESD